MNVVFLYPDENGMEEIRKKISKIRAEAVIEYLNNANATIETKQQVIDELIRIHNSNKKQDEHDL